MIGCNREWVHATWVVGSPPGILELADHFDLKVNERAKLESWEEEPTSGSDGRPVATTAARTFPLCEIHGEQLSKMMLEVGPDFAARPIESTLDEPLWLRVALYPTMSDRTAATLDAIRWRWKEKSDTPKRIAVLGQVVLGKSRWLVATDAADMVGADHTGVDFIEVRKPSLPKRRLLARRGFPPRGDG